MRSARLIAKRLKEARQKAGLSQKDLGLRAGIDPSSASARMNSYELERYMPAPDAVVSIAKVLGIPTPYFYAKNDVLAELILTYGSLTAAERARMVETVRHIARFEDTKNSIPAKRKSYTQKKLAAPRRNK